MEVLSVDDWLQVGRAVGGIIVIITFTFVTIGDAFLADVSFNPWLIVVMLALIYGLLGLDYFVLDHFPMRITITTDRDEEPDEDH